MTENAENSFVETWESVTPSIHWVIKLDFRGDEKVEQIKGPNRRFTVTTEERFIQSERAKAELNPYLNGDFKPVQVPEGLNVETNPNALNDEDVKLFLAASNRVFNEMLERIDSQSTLRRIVDMIENSEVDVAYQRYNQLSSKLDLLKGETRIVQNDQETYEKMGSPIGAARPTARKRAVKKA
jgi:hypothetical protein